MSQISWGIPLTSCPGPFTNTQQVHHSQVLESIAISSQIRNHDSWRCPTHIIVADSLHITAFSARSSSKGFPWHGMFGSLFTLRHSTRLRQMGNLLGHKAQGSSAVMVECWRSGIFCVVVSHQAFSFLASSSTDCGFRLGLDGLVQDN